MNMNFFEQLSSSGDVDITLRIMKKNDIGLMNMPMVVLENW